MLFNKVAMVLTVQALREVEKILGVDFDYDKMTINVEQGIVTLTSRDNKVCTISDFSNKFIGVIKNNDPTLQIVGEEILTYEDVRFVLMDYIIRFSLGY